MKTVRMIEKGEWEPSTPHQQARAIMGRNFFGVEEASKHFGVNYSEEQHLYLTEIPFNRNVLTSCKDTHVLVAVFPISILVIRSKFVGCFRNHDDAWYARQAFAVNIGQVGWQLVRKIPLGDATTMTRNQQRILYSKDGETPKAQVVVYTMIGHFLATGERLFEHVYIRCLDGNSRRRRVGVGSFGVKGLSVYYYYDNYVLRDHCVSSITT